jgi:Flp pilus assembly protein TadG
VSRSRSLRRSRLSRKWPAESTWVGRLTSEAGSITLEIVVLMPAIFAVIFGVVQGAFVYHARHVALAAASEGLAVAAGADSTAEAGRRAASDFLQEAGGSAVLIATSVTAGRSAVSAEVTVAGQAPSLVPGVSGWAVSQTASGPVERFTVQDAP